MISLIQLTNRIIMLKYIITIRDINYDPLIYNNNVFLFKNIVIHDSKINNILVYACKRNSWNL